MPTREPWSCTVPCCGGRGRNSCPVPARHRRPTPIRSPPTRWVRPSLQDRSTIAAVIWAARPFRLPIGEGAGRSPVPQRVAADGPQPTLTAAGVNAPGVPVREAMGGAYDHHGGSLGERHRRRGDDAVSYTHL